MNRADLYVLSHVRVYFDAFDTHVSPIDPFGGNEPCSSLIFQVSYGTLYREVRSMERNFTVSTRMYIV